MATDQVEINAGSQEINDGLSRLVVLEHINDLLRIHHYVPYGHIPYNVQSHIHMYKCTQKWLFRKMHIHDLSSFNKENPCTGSLSHKYLSFVE